MKRCKNRECKGYSQFVDDECTGCPICQGELDLVVESENSNINMGNANAISGGVHSSDDHSKKDSDNVVNSNNETHTNSHNTTNNTTIYEAEKSASEKLEENRLKYRLECKKLFRDGLISNDGKQQLRELQDYLNLADELVSPIQEDVRQQSKTRKAQLSPTGLNDIRQAKSIIEHNTSSTLQNQLEKLEGLMKEFDDDRLRFMYYQMSAMLECGRYTNRYEDSAKDEYWRTYWAYIAYLLQDRNKEAYEAFALLRVWRDYPEQNNLILQLAGRLMQNEQIEDAIDVRNQITQHFTSDLRLLLDAIDELLQMDWAKESIVIRPAHSFYVNTLFRHFVEAQRTVGLQRLKERHEQEIIKREEEERIRLAELERQNKIRTQKTSVLNKFQEIGNIEIACQEAGVEFLTFNVWLEEDSTFASSYNDLVHRMEVRKYEVAEKIRKEQEIEAETKQKKSQFKILFEQNKCDLLKTCSELGCSSADYQEWRRVDSVFNDDINYIIRENQKVINQQYRQKRAKIIKKVSLIIGALTILWVLVLGAKAIINNINATKAAEEARIEQEENHKREIGNQHESLINTFNDILDNIDKTKYSSTPNVKEFNSALTRLEETLKEIKRFESSNPSVAAEYEKLKQQCKNICEELGGIFFTKSTDPLDPNILQNGPKWNGMKENVESLTNRL